MDLLECAFDGGEVGLFHGVYELDGPFRGIARYVYAHLRPYGGFNIRRTAAVLNHGSTHASQSVLSPYRCRLSWQLLRRCSCGAPEGNSAFQPCLLETLVSSLFLIDEGSGLQEKIG